MVASHGLYCVKMIAVRVQKSEPGHRLSSCLGNAPSSGLDTAFNDLHKAKIRVGVLNCSAPLPSGKSTIKKFGLSTYYKVKYRRYHSVTVHSLACTAACNVCCKWEEASDGPS